MNRHNILDCSITQQERLTSDKHPYLLGQFLSCEENEVLWIWPQINGSDTTLSYPVLPNKTFWGGGDCASSAWSNLSEIHPVVTYCYLYIGGKCSLFISIFVLHVRHNRLKNILGCHDLTSNEQNGKESAVPNNKFLFEQRVQIKL
jgi:hypothetical protein